MNKKAIYPLFVVNFFSIAAINMVQPLVPQLIKSLGFPSFMFGIFFACTAMANLIFSPIWGRFSDRRGRKIVIMIGLAGSALSQLAFGLADSIILVIVLRFMTGVFIAAYLTSTMSFLADITNENKRGTHIAYFSAISTMGTSLGSFVGGIIGERHYTYVFIAQFIWISILIIMIGFFIKEDKVIKGNNNTLKRKKYFELKIINIKTPVGIMILSIIMISFAITNYSSSIAYYIETVFKLSPSEIGTILSLTGIISILMNVIVNPLLLKKFNEKKLFATTAFLAGISMIFVARSESMPLFIGGVVLYLAFSNLNMPLQQSIISKLSKGNTGEIIGSQNSARSIGMVVGSLFAGFIFDMNNKIPFLMCGSIFILTAIGLFLIEKRDANNDINSEVSKSLY